MKQMPRILMKVQRRKIAKVSKMFTKQVVVKNELEILSAKQEAMKKELEILSTKKDAVKKELEVAQVIFLFGFTMFMVILEIHLANILIFRIL